MGRTAGNCLVSLEIAGIDWKGLEMDGNGDTWLEIDGMAGIGWEWLNIVGNGINWLE